MNILGLNAYHGDSAACLVIDGQFAARRRRWTVSSAPRWMCWLWETGLWSGRSGSNVSFAFAGRVPYLRKSMVLRAEK